VFIAFFHLFNVDHFDRIQQVEQHPVVAHPKTLPKGVVCERDNTGDGWKSTKPCGTARTAFCADLSPRLVELLGGFRAPNRGFQASKYNAKAI
jgi:hypothetical protein